MGEYQIGRSQLVPPGPTLSGLDTGQRHQVVINDNPVATIIEFDDVLFRTNSAVVMPSGEAPSPDAITGQIRTLVGIAASVLRHLEEYADDKLLVAGHTDTTGSPQVNVELSQYRAACVTAVLAGDADAFAAICATWKRMCVADYQQILAWVADTRGWDCHPGPITNQHNNATQQALTRFRELYNEVGPGSTWAPKCNRWGEAVDPSTWVAYFNCYEEALAQELGTDAAGVAQLRANLRFLTAQGYVGCGEAHPKEAENVDEYRSQTNRRVEAMFFSPGNEPKLACDPDFAGCQPQTCELFDLSRFRRRILPPMLSAKPWQATWDADETHEGEIRQMLLVAPGLPPGVAMTYAVEQENAGPAGSVSMPSQGEAAAAPWDQWFQPDLVQVGPDLEPGQDFPAICFRFTVTGGGRRKQSSLCRYADRALLRLTDGQNNALAGRPYLMLTHWGSRRGTTDGNGVVDEKALPPGGINLLLDENNPIGFGRLAYH